MDVASYLETAGTLAWEVPSLPEETPHRPIRTVGVIGAGTMGGGISMNFVNAGLTVKIVETQQDALDRGLKVVRGNYERSAKRGRFPMEEVDERMSRFIGTLSLNDLADCDLVIEAVFENMDVKKEICF